MTTNHEHLRELNAYSSIFKDEVFNTATIRHCAKLFEESEPDVGSHAWCLIPSWLLTYANTLDELAALRKENEGLRLDAERWRQFLKMVDPDKVPGGFTLYFAIEEGTDQLCYADDDIVEIVDAARAAIGDSHE